MSRRRTGIVTLAAAGITALLLTGVAAASPMGGGMGGRTTGTPMMGGGVTTTVTVPATGTGPGTGLVGGGMGRGTTAGTTMMQGGLGTGPGPTTGTTPPATGPTTGPGTTTGPGMMGHMFTDVAGSDWYAPYAEQMANAGFMTVFANGTFGADAPLTRGQFAGILGRMMQLAPTAGPSFTDTQGFWGAGMVATMARLGILTGHADGTFGPYDAVTREQMAAIMDRAWTEFHAGAPLTDLGTAMTAMMQRVHDVSGSWAAPQIAQMMQMGVFQGTNGLFHPTDTATRAQAAAVMWRWFEAGQTQK